MSFYSLLLPPPNLTGALHLGHLWNIVLQDLRYKWEEIRRAAIYWAIGVDHAGLSFQSKFDSLYGHLHSNRDSDEYLNEMHKYASSLREHIHSQFQLISKSLPVHRSRYTLEEQSKKFVIEKFVRLHSQGLIYKGKRLVNWDVQRKEVLSDCEVEYKTEKSNLYYLRYFLASHPSKKYVIVATSRPETIFGDVALFVNSEDVRYSSLIGKTVKVPIIGREIPVLADPSIDSHFGTGVMKCTPAHDSLDWELGKKHNLENLQTIDEDGKFNSLAGEFEGQDRLRARDKIVEKLRELNQLEKIEEYETKLAYSTKSNTLTEKILTEQWFLSASELSKNLAKTLREKRFKFKTIPSSQEERLLTYLDSMEDWCISRQIPWGIKIPIVYDTIFKKYRVNQIVKDTQKERQEEIVLDTWFSSALWPFIVFEGYERDKDRFFPFTDLITGKDILLLWVSRMMFLSLHLYAKLPFKNVYLHGLLKNKEGEKMSKSLGNGVLPEELYKTFSPDVVRVALLMNTCFDRDLRYSDLIFQKASTFLHKLEHIFNFFKQKINPELNPELLEKPDHFGFTHLKWAERWIYRQFSILGEKIDKLYAEYNYYALSRELVHFFSEVLSNKFLELFKLEKNLDKNIIQFLAYLWEVSTRIIYPLTPDFASRTYREIFSREIKGVYSKYFYPTEITNDSLRFEWFFEYMSEVRRIYQALSLNYSTQVKLTIVLPPKSKYTESEIQELSHYFKKLNHVLVACTTTRRPAHYPTIKLDELYFELELSGFEKSKYLSFVNKEFNKYSLEVERAKRILSRNSFRENAAPELVKSEKLKLKNYVSLKKFYSELNQQLS